MLSSKTSTIPCVVIRRFDRPVHSIRPQRGHVTPLRRFRIYAEKLQEQEIKDSAKETEVEEVTKKWGLEAGLFKAMTSDKDGKKGSGEIAKELLKKYGSAYLITSISFAIVSYAICYFLVDIGVDVAALLSKVGINVSNTSEKIGTAAIAYAAHKAASPIRFPPTVALTPVVANWFGKKQDKEDDST
eukprot:g7042.t1